MKMTGPQLMFENFNFGLDGSAPEFPVEIAAAPGATRVVFEAGWVADGINLKEEAFRSFKIAVQVEEKFRGGEGAGGFVTMNGGKDADANRIAAVGAEESEPGQGIFLAADFERTCRIDLNGGNIEQWLKKPFNRTTSILDGAELGKVAIHSLQQYWEKVTRKKVKTCG
jgi:hypothetical protein